jgi:CRP-like cAMP-binding protein
MTTSTATEALSAADDGGLRDHVVRALPGCRPETIGRLIQTAAVRSVDAGDRIYRQGDPVPLTLILDGFGAARRTTINGKELVSGVAPAGVLFGWSGLAAVPSSVELVALTPCRVAQWQGEEVRQLSAADPGLALVAIDSMAWSLHQTVERIEGFLHQDARLRVLRILAQYRELIFGESPILTRAHLPGLVGTSREITGQVQRQLEREGPLARHTNGALQLLRPDRLDAGPA